VGERDYGKAELNGGEEGRWNSTIMERH
jgi:hypothetical protein